MSQSDGAAAHTGSGLVVGGDPSEATAAAARQAREALAGRVCDLAVVFAAGDHLVDPEATVAIVDDVLAPGALIGCGAAGVIGQAEEVESGTAISVWAASLGAGRATAFHVDGELDPDRNALRRMLPDFDGASGALLLADPFTYPTDPALSALSARSPGVPLIGGLASGCSREGATPLFLGRRVVRSGAVGVRLDGVRLVPWVSQGATPIGPELTITSAQGRVVKELAGRPALAKLRETINSLSPRDLARLQDRVLMGIVIDPHQPEYIQGNFLVRGVVGADPATSELVMGGAVVQEGQVVRLHVCDPENAGRALHEALARHGEAPPAGALLISCNGRGRDMFGHPNHDVGVLNQELGGAPTAGFFAAGEIGPIGGRYFLHSLTATVAVLY